MDPEHLARRTHRRGMMSFSGLALVISFRLCLSAQRQIFCPVFKLTTEFVLSVACVIVRLHVCQATFIQIEKLQESPHAAKFSRCKFLPGICHIFPSSHSLPEKLDRPVCSQKEWIFRTFTLDSSPGSDHHSEVDDAERTNML